MENQAFNTSSDGLTALSPSQIEIIKSTAPILQSLGATGAQPTALAHAVWAYAAKIDNLGALGPAVSRITHKHASLGVHPDQYSVVGKQLLASIREVLGGEVATEPVLGAWAIAYNQLADIFIKAEKDLHREAASQVGGWEGWRPFHVQRKVRESEEITSFYLVPADTTMTTATKLPAFKAGQFISVRCFIPELGLYQPRQYSISDTPITGTHFRISVKREKSRGKQFSAGLVSNILHDCTPEGSLIDVSMPYGKFSLNLNANTPVVLMSGGVGLTPMMSMLKTLVLSSASPPRRVLFVHAVRNKRVHAMNSEILDVMSRCPQVERFVFYDEISKEDDILGVDYDVVGRVDILSDESVKRKVLIPDADYYICGPGGFMDMQRNALLELGIAENRIHWEVFGVV